MVVPSMGGIQHLGGWIAREFGDHVVDNSIIEVRGFYHPFATWSSTILARDRPKIQGDHYYSCHGV